MATIELVGVEKVYEGGVRAVRELDLSVDDGELLVLLGPSGCGKSTVLRLVAGLEPLTAGEIRVGGRRIDHEPARDRDVAMVFQSYALYGHMTVRQNLEFPLRMRGVERAERRRRVEEIATLLELGQHLDARPRALSGGQQQRVAMGRALVRRPRAFLLDEPLSNLDARLRAQVRSHIAELQARLGVTTLYVTHDQVEALGLGHRIAVLRHGGLQQIARGQELYDRPANAFVAQFLGQPGMNLIRGRLDGSGPSLAVHLGPAGTLPVRPEPHGLADGENALDPSGSRAGSGREVLAGVRPEALEIVDEPGHGEVVAEVRNVEALGAERIVYLMADVSTLDLTGEPGGSGPAGRGGPLLAVRTGTGRRPASPGDIVGLRADPGLVHLFDTAGLTVLRSP